MKINQNFPIFYTGAHFCAFIFWKEKVFYVFLLVVADEGEELRKIVVGEVL